PAATRSALPRSRRTRQRRRRAQGRARPEAQTIAHQAYGAFPRGDLKARPAVADVLLDDVAPRKGPIVDVAELQPAAGRERQARPQFSVLPRLARSFWRNTSIGTGLPSLNTCQKDQPLHDGAPCR